MPTKKRSTEKVRKESEALKKVKEIVKRYFSILLAFILSLLAIAALFAPIFIGLAITDAFKLDIIWHIPLIFGFAALIWPIGIILVTNYGEKIIDLWQYGFEGD